MKQIYKISILIIVSLGLSNCATNSSKSYKPKKSTIPKVPAKQIPGGTTDNWRYLGTSQDGQIAVEISESSISKTANSVKFQDRKTLTNTQKNSTSGTIGNYKYSLSWWNMDCSNKQYYINNTAIYDDYGKLLKNYNFSSTQAITISGGSIAELQYNYVCQGINRQIGY
ncbi:MAG: hypothetical protein E6Q33_00245 [Neisseriales bacterium]|nr:MAG: hypothetical protein E6Q33_00245 [Neisseriales bacterium]